MRVLVITSRLAEDSVAQYISELNMKVDVLALPVSVAAFITPKFAADALRGRDVKDYDVILLPGAVQGDVTPVEVATGVATYKGPVHIAELPLILGLLNDVELSKTIPASELVKDTMRDRAEEIFEEVERKWREILKKFGGFVIGKGGNEIPVGRGFPMRVIAEIVNAPLLNLDAVRSLSRYFEREGADIIDIGMLAGKKNPEKIKGIVESVRKSVNLPISIDTLEPLEIEAAVEAGVDLILSVDSGNIEEVAPRVLDIPVVVLPSNMREGTVPTTAEEKLTVLKENIERARSYGLEMLIADPILEPVLNPGLFESLRSYQLFRQYDLETPMLFGLGNVTELIDVDSVGVNGLLTALACEVGADLLFIPEYSSKARGSVRETATASKMMFLSKRRNSVPKDLGIDLLILKEKSFREDCYDIDIEKKIDIVKADLHEKFELDRAGWFKIHVDREGEMIVAIHYPHGNTMPDILIKGKDATKVYKTIVRDKLVSRLDHAAYLGKELNKAEIALKLGRSYVQDDELL